MINKSRKQCSALLHLSMSNVSKYYSINAYLFLRNVFYKRYMMCVVL